MSDGITNILMVGVGGQGIVLSSDIVCDVALAEGFDVKKSEIHGMAQRGGSVVSHVRFGKTVDSPVIPAASADFVVSFEKMEYLRYLDMKKPESVLVINTQAIFPPSVSGGQEEYPHEAAESGMKKFAAILPIDAMAEANRIGNPRIAGMVVLGMLARKLPFGVQTWKDVISASVPKKTVDMNISAFDAGYNA